MTKQAMLPHATGNEDEGGKAAVELPAANRQTAPHEDIEQALHYAAWLAEGQELALAD